MNYYFEKEAQNEKRDHLNMINAFELLKSFEKDFKSSVKISNESISKYTYFHVRLL